MTSKLKFDANYAPRLYNCLKPAYSTGYYRIVISTGRRDKRLFVEWVWNSFLQHLHPVSNIVFSNLLRAFTRVNMVRTYSRLNGWMPPPHPLQVKNCDHLYLSYLKNVKFSGHGLDHGALFDSLYFRNISAILRFSYDQDFCICGKSYRACLFLATVPCLLRNRPLGQFYPSSLR